MTTIRVDLHCHSRHSRDCLLELETIIAVAQRRGLGALALTDHNTIAGAVELARMAPFPVIVGEEIMTSQGEIIGLYLQETIPAGLAPQAAIAAIREQGGLVYVPHPLDRVRGSRLRPEALQAVIGQADIVETFNARVTWARDNELAAELARSHGLAAGGGSDAHSAFELGRAYVCMAPFAGRDDFLAQLARGRVGGRLSPAPVHVSSMWARRYKKWFLNSRPAPRAGQGVS